MHTTYQFRDQTLDRSQTASRLKALALDGLRQNYPEQADRLAPRLCGELAAIESDPDLLQRVVALWDLARYAGEHKICTAPANDKLSASLTACCLGISRPDPDRAFRLPPDGLCPEDLQLQVPAGGWPELTCYLKRFYPQLRPETVLVQSGPFPEQPGHLEGDEARYAAAWLGELRRRLDRIYEQMPEDFSSVNFEYWMERCMDLSEQVSLLERLLYGCCGKSLRRRLVASAQAFFF